MLIYSHTQWDGIRQASSQEEPVGKDVGGDLGYEGDD